MDHYLPGDFTDGLAHTAGMSERLIGSGKGWRHRGDSHHANTDLCLDAEDLLAVCGNVASGTPRFAQSLLSWILGGYENTLYKHPAPRNFAVINCTPEGSAIPNTNGGLFPPRSRHQGVNVLLMDGAVRLMSHGIDFKTW